MNLAAKLAWQYRVSWLAMLLLTSASSLVLILSTHATHANEIIAARSDQVAINFDLYISALATFLVVQTIAALCLESQAKDLAVIKTCGASQKELRRTLLAQIIIVTICGFIAGWLISLPIRETYVHISTANLTDRVSDYFGQDIGSYTTALFTLLIAVVLGSLKTIARVSRQNVVSALHGDSAEVQTKRGIGASIALVLAIIVAVFNVIVIFASGLIVTFLSTKVSGGDAEQQGIITSAQGSLILFPSILFIMACMAIFAILAPKLYPAILQTVSRRLPRRVPGALQVGINLARYNAAKYYGSITPLVIFVLTIIMMFGTIAGAQPALNTMYMQHNVDPSQLGGTNYPVVALLIGPALFIAFIGSLCNIMMSGRGRIYTNKLTAILGLRPRAQYGQSLAEMGGYVLVAALIGLVITLICGALTMVAGSLVSGVKQPFAPAWNWFGLSLLVIMAIVAVPAIVSVIRSRHIPNKAALESFGE